MSDAILQATERIGRSKIHLKYLEYFYEKAELIINVDDLSKDGKFISAGPYTKEDMHVILSMLSSKLMLEDKIAIKMFKTENLIIVEVK